MAARRTALAYSSPGRERRDDNVIAVETGLAGKGVLVTGGGGGIGSACVRAFAAEGARVAIHYRTSRDQAEELARETGGVALQADLTVEEEADGLFKDAERELGGVEVCAALAGFWPREDEPVWRLPLERWEATLRTNLTATFLTARAFLRLVERSGHGNLVLVGSTAGRFGEAGHADYAAAKAAIQVGLLLSLKNEIVRVAPRGRVNAVAPGWTYSPMTRGELEDEFVARLTRTMALRKVARAEDVARAVVALASDELSGHVTGELVTVAGGMEGRTVHDA
jgi:3-oxoacyl-[acyl-carrier protein] reductase